MRLVRWILSPLRRLLDHCSVAERAGYQDWLDAGCASNAELDETLPRGR